jgi:hypothetical protein
MRVEVHCHCKKGMSTPNISVEAHDRTRFGFNFSKYARETSGNTSGPDFTMGVTGLLPE